MRKSRSVLVVGMLSMALATAMPVYSATPISISTGAGSSLQGVTSINTKTILIYAGVGILVNLLVHTLTKHNTIAPGYGAGYGGGGIQDDTRPQLRVSFGLKF